MKPDRGASASVFTINVKPVIAELARTGVSFPSIQLLVDKIAVQLLPNPETPTGAFLLWLTDGEMVIQALVKRRHYKRLLIGDIREGSYVLLKEYLVTRANKVNGEGEVIHLVLKDFYAIGEDEREKPEMPEFEKLTPHGAEQLKTSKDDTETTEERSFSDAPIIPSPKRPRLVDERPTLLRAPASVIDKPEISTASGSSKRRRLVDEEPIQRSSPTVTDVKDKPVIEPGAPSKRRRLVDEKPTVLSSKMRSGSSSGKTYASDQLTTAVKHRLPSSSPIKQNTAKKQKLEIALGEIDPNFGSPPKRTRPNDASIQTSSILPKKPSSSQERPPSHAPQPSPAQNTSTKVHAAGSPSSSAGPTIRAKPPEIRQTRIAPDPTTHLAPIERPLNIIPLSKLRGTRRNRVYDVFVVIDSVAADVTQRSRLVPAQRDLRVVDPSTDKKVCLSVFVAPEDFFPSVGTVALVRSVTTHEWDGGSIKVYPQHCEGRRWFVEDPVGVRGCDVEGLRRWWVGRNGKEKGEM